MPPARAYLFLDTSVLIHGLPIEQVEWAKHFGFDEVVLVLASTVMSELDKLKDGAEGRLSRNRARDFFARFQRYEASVLDPPGAGVRGGVWLRVLTNEPALFAGADPLVQDDRIVSAVLAFECEPGAQKLLCARDTNILLKARAKGLRAERLPEDWELQPEADPVEKELRATKQELAELKGRQPRISLLIVHGDQQHAQYVDAVVGDVRVPDEHEIERRYANEEQRCRSSASQFGGLLAFMKPSEQQVEQHLTRYREYLEKVPAIERDLGLRVQVGLVLSNGGTAPATKIEIDVTAGERIRFGYVDDRPSAPRRPKLRSSLENFAEAAQYFDQNAALFGAGRALPRGLRNIRVEPERVEFVLKDVMHHDQRVLDEFDVVLPVGWQSKGFTLEVALRVAELPKPTRITFNVRTRVERREPFSGPEEEGDGQ